MIGNDIVDLALARQESNWQRKGFLDKLFTPHEQQLILNADNPEITVWNLWSRKEAAYKIYNRETGIRAFNPLQFECIFENAGGGRVICNGKIYYTRSRITSDSVQTVAVTDQKHFNFIKILKIRKGIIKENGIPCIGTNPVSISGHGRFKQIITLSYNPSLDFNFRKSNAMA